MIQMGPTCRSVFHPFSSHPLHISFSFSAMLLSDYLFLPVYQNTLPSSLTFHFSPLGQKFLAKMPQSNLNLPFLLIIFKIIFLRHFGNFLLELFSSAKESVNETMQERSISLTNMQRKEIIIITQHFRLFP